jgi:1-acyl-sn-glycerol-3-phosphate acyltransferase
VSDSPEHHLAHDEEALDEVRAALADLRHEIDTRFGRRPATPDPRPDLPVGRDVMDLFDQARRRLQTFGMVERSGEVDEFGLDDVVVSRAAPFLDFMLERWWRADVAGLENLPVEGPCLLVANRSGLLPWDGLMISHAVSRWHPRAERPRFLVADWLVTLPFAQPTLARVGGVRACRENAERLLRSGRWVVAFPEGQKGAAKVFRDRYRLQRFGRGGAVRVALENQVPLVPVGVVGAEEAHPVLFKVTAPARAVGLPFMPVTPTFPLMGPFGALPLPARWGIRFGEPLAFDRLTPDDASDELLVSRLTAELRTSIQELVETGLRARSGVFS